MNLSRNLKDHTREFPLIQSTISLLIGGGLWLAALPNQLVYFPFGIFMAFIPLILTNYRTKGIKRSCINLGFCSMIAAIMIFPLDHSSLAYRFPDTACIIMLFLIIAAAYAACFTGAAKLADTIGWSFSPLIFALLWQMTQMILSALPVTFAFPIETSLFRMPELLQMSRIFGAHALGTLIIFTNAALAYTVIEKDKRKVITMMMVFIAIHTANLGYGIMPLCKDNIGPTIKVALIQPNVTSKDYLRKQECRLLKKHIDSKLINLTMASLEHSPDLVIWPELARSYALQNDPLLAKLHSEITSRGCELLVGTNYHDYGDSRDYNIAFLLRSDGSNSEAYRKIRPFPFIEAGAYGRGREAITLGPIPEVDGIGCMICLESLYPAIAKKMTANGAELLATISTDASFGNSMIPYIHAASTVLRAIENDRPAVHAGNTGPSLVCDNKGRIKLYIPYGMAAFGYMDIYISKR